MKKIVIAGTIASGKTTVTLLLKQMGFAVFDSDHYGHIALLPNHPIANQLIAHFKDKITTHGEIDRKKLAKEIFQDEQSRQFVNHLIHPFVKEGMLKFIQRHQQDDFVFCEVPLLFEVGWYDCFDEIWVITTTKEKAIQRMMEDRGYTQQEAFARYQSQSQFQLSDTIPAVVIDNSQDIKALYEKIKERIAYED